MLVYKGRFHQSVYLKLLRVKTPKAQKYIDDLSVFLCF